MELKGLVEPLERLIGAAEKARRSAQGGQAIDYAEIERIMQERAPAIERAAHEAILPALEVSAPRVKIGGKMYTRIVRSSPGTYTAR